MRTCNGTTLGSPFPQQHTETGVRVRCCTSFMSGYTPAHGSQCIDASTICTRHAAHPPACALAGYIEDQQLTAFDRALRDAKVLDLDNKMQLISFGPGIFFPDDKALHRSDLLVRNCYNTLFERISSMPDSLLTGVPGTGKAEFREPRISYEANRPGLHGMRVHGVCADN